ncbi:MAG: radical SAM protein [Candidatus Hydrogenedentes bacterium]|nr:radical SAM protein [Candidatus Hydrogenedentota bacterium]
MTVVPLISNRLVQWQHQRPQGPWRLLALPTYRCNVKCGICVRNWYPMPDFLFDELPDERWLRLVDEAGDLGVRSFVIGGGGEPMLRGNLVTEMCVKAKARGMEGRLQTNGTRMPEESMKAFIKAGWDCLSISLDGPDAAVNDAIRFEGAFNKISTTLHALRDMKKRYRSVLPTVSIHMTVTAQNHNRLEDMVAFCLDNGVDMLAASPLIENGMEDTGYLLNRDERAALPSYIRAAVKKADAAGLPHTLLNLLMLVEEAESDTATGKPACPEPTNMLAGAYCLEPWTGVSIISSGHISPCCFFWDEKAESIRDMTLAEAWNGSYMAVFRERMLQGRLRGECVHCPFPHSEEHVALKKALQNTSKDGGNVGLPRRLITSLRNHGIRGSYRRFKEWRVIRRATRQEHKSRP